MSMIAIRWRDLDALGHVNSAVFLTYLEAGRDLWLREVLGETFQANQYVVVRVEVDFCAEIRQGTPYVESLHDVEAVGGSSITLNERLRDPAGVTVAQARVVIVLWDPDEHSSRAVTELERAALLELAIAS